MCVRGVEAGVAPQHRPHRLCPSTAPAPPPQQCPQDLRRGAETPRAPAELGLCEGGSVRPLSPCSGAGTLRWPPHPASPVWVPAAAPCRANTAGMSWLSTHTEPGRVPRDPRLRHPPCPVSMAARPMMHMAGGPGPGGSPGAALRGDIPAATPCPAGGQQGLTPLDPPGSGETATAALARVTDGTSQLSGVPEVSQGQPQVSARLFPAIICSCTHREGSGGAWAA